VKKSAILDWISRVYVDVDDSGLLLDFSLQAQEVLVVLDDDRVVLDCKTSDFPIPRMRLRDLIERDSLVSRFLQHIDEVGGHVLVEQELQS
jgi:hypothetical protein